MNTFSIIVAIAQDGAIGKDGDLMWHLHEDMVYFRNTTRGHPVIMGRKTWDSLQVRPLPKRDNYVITKQKDFSFEGVKVLHSLEEVKLLPDTNEEYFIIGGGSIYKELLPLCKNLYITHIDKAFPQADTFFPVVDLSQWDIVSESQAIFDPEEKTTIRFVKYSRVQPAIL